MMGCCAAEVHERVNGLLHQFANGLIGSPLIQRRDLDRLFREHECAPESPACPACRDGYGAGQRHACGLGAR
jgi:hypothetical protein